MGTLVTICESLMKFMHSSMFTIDGNWGATIKYTAQTQHKTPNISENKTKGA